MRNLAAADVRSMESRSNPPNYWLIYGGPLLLVAATIGLRFSYFSSIWWTDWMFWLPVVHLLLIAPGTVWYRKSPAALRHASAATSFIAAMLVAMYMDCFDESLFFVADSLIHFGMPVGWGLAAIGIVAVPLLLKRRWMFALKVWVLTVSVLLSGEVAARFLETTPGNASKSDLELPDQLADPPDGEIHIAAIGGSSTLGHPYQPKFGFPQIVAWRLQQQYPDRKVVLHNLASSGANLRQAASKLQRLPVRPHLLLVYTGHNEFYHDAAEFQDARKFIESGSRPRFTDRWMNWSAMYRMSRQWLAQNLAMRKVRRGRRSLVEQPVVSRPVYRRRLDRFRAQCRQLNDFCKRSGIVPIWFVPAASESGFEPNSSGFRDESKTADAREIERLYENARKQTCTAAIKFYRKALQRYPRFAEFHYRLAQCLQQTGDIEGARKHYQLALDEDLFPIRANRDYRRVIRDTARTTDTPLVETGASLRSRTSNGILGTTLFLDNVHMTLAGYYFTAVAGCETIDASEVFVRRFGRPQRVPMLTLAECIAKAGLSREDLSEAYRRTSFSLGEMQRWRIDGTERGRQADRFKRLAEQLKSGAISPGEEGTESLSPE